MNRRVLSGALAALVVLGSSAGLRTVRADSAVKAPTRRIVELSVPSGGPEATRLLDTVRELLGRLGVTTSVAGASPRGNDDALLARVDVELRADEAQATVVSGRSGDVVAQKVVPRGASGAVMREELAHGIQAAVESLLLIEKDPSKAPPPAPVASTPAPAPPPPEPVQTAPIAAAPEPAKEALPVPSPWSLEAELAGGGYGYASGTVAPRLGGGLWLAHEGRWRPSLAGNVQVAIPFGVSSELVTLQTGIVSLRLLPAVQLVRVGVLALDLGAGGGLDVVSVRPESSILPASRLTPPFSRVDGVLQAALAARFAVTGGLFASLLVGLDVSPASRSYVVDDGASKTEIAEPWSVRPSLALAFGFTALGSGRFVAGGTAP